RHIPDPIRDQVLVRAGFQCQYEHKGRRCASRTGLEIDHIQPHGRNGSDDIDNLRALCRSHNLWFAERHYGCQFIRDKIDATRTARSASTAT
ncbi:MAG: HNH endonuclease, partial [Planctomycetes bacterium]|nr:HNH endonuclease [Planctomycetota bacterium]